MKAKTSFSLNLTLKFNRYVTYTGPRRLNVMLMWPARQKELTTPAVKCKELIIKEKKLKNVEKK